MKKIALAVLLLATSTVPAASAGYDDLNVGFSYFNQGQYDNAIPWFDKAIATGDLIPDLLRVAYLDRGKAYRAKGDLQKALADYSAAIAAEPGDMLAYRERIPLYLAANDLEKTLADYEVLRKQRPHEYEILLTSGYLNWLLGHQDVSAEDFSYFSRRFLYPWLWLQVTNVKLGRPMTGNDMDVMGTNGWPAPIAQFYLGRISEADVLKKADDFKNVNGPCSAFILTGMWRVVHHDQTGAIPLLQSASDTCTKQTFFWRIARAELEKIMPLESK